MSDNQFDKAAEQELLGSIFLKPEIYKKIDLTVDDFFLPNHRLIFEIIGSLDADGLEINLRAVFAEATKRNLLDKIGGPRYLSDITDNSFSADWPTYARIVKERSAFRKLLQVGLKIQRCAKNGGDIKPAIIEIYDDVRSIRGLVGISDLSMHRQVRDWVLTTNGQFLTTSCYAELGLATKDHKKAAIMALLRLKEEGVIVECGDKRGCYRTVEHDAPEIDWQDADIDTVYDLKWPFALETLVNIYPKNIIILAGASNAGKTAFLLNFVKMNLAKHKIRFLSSEMGPEEMKLRITKFSDYNREFWKPFKPRERATNFADAVSPSQINIIDYYEISDNFYSIGGELRVIHDKLKSGIAIIAIQKKGNQELGRGAEFSLEKPRLYLSMDAGELKIVKGKNWARPGWNPNGMVFRYKLINGCEFLEIPD